MIILQCLLYFDTYDSMTHWFLISDCTFGYHYPPGYICLSHLLQPWPSAALSSHIDKYTFHLLVSQRKA